MTRNSKVEGNSTRGEEVRDINELIDLFVEMNFSFMTNPGVLSQFMLLAKQIGYTEQEITQVVDLGRREYRKLLDELNNSPYEVIRNLSA